MIEKKISMIGSFAVGKTSLVRRFIEGIYSDTYQTTVGVKIDKKTVHAGDREVKLVLWDLYGEDDFQKIKWYHVRGSSGYLLVADGTRKATFDKALALEEKIREEIGKVPFIFVINKSDLSKEWEIEDAAQQELIARGWNTLRTSAKSGEGVEDAFQKLTEQMLD